MAVVFEGFSIREYTSKVRSVDVAKCWPFSNETSRETIDSLLPPITVTKFRWWSHELDRLRSNKNTSEAVDTEFFREAEESEDDEKRLEVACHEQGCLAQVSLEGRRHVRMAAGKPKCRAPKKRSIVEIFAVAPQIHKVHDDDDEDVGEASGQQEEETPEVGDDGDNIEVFNYKSDKKKNKKKKTKKVTLADKLVNKKKKNKKKQAKLKKKSNYWEEPIAKKEKPYQLKLHTKVDLARKPDGSICCQGIAEDTFHAVANHKKPDLQCLSAQQKEKVAQSSKASAKQLKSVFPVRSILKNNRKAFSMQNPGICRMQSERQVNLFSIQHSDKHVRFSDQNDVLGSSKKYIPSYEKSVCNLHSDALAPSQGKDQSAARNKHLATTDGNGADDVPISTENRKRLQPVTAKEQSADACEHIKIPHFLRPHFSYPEGVRHMTNKSLAPPQVVMCDDKLNMADQSSQTASNNCSYASHPGPFSAMKGVHNPSANSQMCNSVPRASSSSGQLIDYFEDHIHRVAAISSKTNRKAFPQFTSSAFALNEIAHSGVPFLSQSAAENVSSHALRYEPFCCQSPVELMGSLPPFPEWKQREITLREKCMEDGLLGLPLNSQGELVQGNSIRIGGFNQLETSRVTTGSSSLSSHNVLLPRSVDYFSNVKEKHVVEAAFPDDQLNLFPVENYRKERRPAIYLPARLGVNQSVSEKDVSLLGYERENSHSFCSLDSNLTLMNNSFNRGKQHQQFQDQIGNGMPQPRENSGHISPNNGQPTMRLMGKDVTIGRSSTEIQQCGERKVWNNEETITENTPFSSAIDISSFKGHLQHDWFLYPAVGKSKETPTQPFEIHRNEVVQSNIFVRAPESRFYDPHPNWQTHEGNQNSSLIAKGKPTSRFLHFGPAMFNEVPNFQESILPGAEPVGITSQLPMLYTPSACQYMDRNPADFKYKQNPPHVTKSSFNFPFLHPASGEHIQSLWSENSSKGLIPWFLHATQQVKATSNPQTFCDGGGKYHSHVSGTDFLTAPSVPHSPVVTYPHNPVTSYSHVETSVGPASILHSPLLPAPPGMRQNYSINASKRNRGKAKDGMKSKTVGVIDSVHGHKTSKRPAAKEDFLPKPAKIPNLGMQDDLGSVTGLPGERFNNILQSDAGALDSSGNKGSSEECAPDEPQADELTSLGMDASKVDGTRSGPIKLSAGAKHILKPREDSDQDNSRLIHSTVPFTSVTDCGSFPETQNKSTKIYWF